MIFSKLYKWRNLIICVMVIAGIAFYFITQLHPIQPAAQHVTHMVSDSSYIKDVQVIDRDLVIKTLQVKGQLTGLESESIKHFTYTDNIFETKGWIADIFGQRTLDVTSQVFFKTGINISDLVNDDSLRVINNTIHIKLPKEILVSLDIPFDKMGFTEHNGVFRSSLTLEQKQQLYTQIRASVEQNIMSDDTIRDKTMEGIKQNLTLMLEKIPNVKSIVFSPRLD